jgi:deoxyhypusine monooxygenase
LSALLRDTTGQHAMVRHEAAEALGAIAGADGESGGGAAEVVKKEEEEEKDDKAAAAATATAATAVTAAAEVEAACRALLKEHLNDACEEVRETCELALARIEYVERERERRRREAKKDEEEEGKDDKEAKAAAAPAGESSFQESPYFSVDPTPALPSTTPLPLLESLLMDPKKPMFERYQALFALRNRGGPDSVGVLCRALRESASALLKHEVAYVLGQMQSPASVRALHASLADVSEHPMVRHEAAEALGAVAMGGEEEATRGEEEEATEALRRFSQDAEPIVAESCAVALDVAARAKAFEYADMGGRPESEFGLSRDSNCDDG